MNFAKLSVLIQKLIVGILLQRHCGLNQKNRMCKNRDLICFIQSIKRTDIFSALQTECQPQPEQTAVL